MKTSNINLILMLTSGIIVGIIGVYSGYPLAKLAYTLVIVLVLFFILGSILDFFFNKILVSVKKDEEESAEEIAEDLEESSLEDGELSEPYEEDELTEDEFENEINDLVNTSEGEIVSKEDDQIQ